jgi:SAM-dependent methyltransferase
VTGVDISPVQIERARSLVPEAEFICADMAEVGFGPEEFDAVVCLYALIHLPLEEQPGLLANIKAWLKPKGRLLCTVGHTAWTGTEEDWLGVPGAVMFWGHADQRTYEEWLHDLGFRIEAKFFIPEGDGGHTALLAERCAGR